ncbi:MAG: ABC transporter ATP-binding protein [Myxococcota bacterium]|nr:ABC transporter ATP-binding protein [Myxococcota bacterium]
MSAATDTAPRPPAAKREKTPVRDVLAFVWGYWRQVPLRLAGMVVGVTLGVVLEVQIPRFSADLVAQIERLLRGAATVADAREAALWLIGLFAATFAVKQLYLRNWMYLASQVMQQLLADGFRQVQRFSQEWHSNHFAGSTQRKITRGMWAYDSLADTLVVDLGPAIGLLAGFTAAMALRDPALGLYFGLAVAFFLTVSILLSARYVAPANVVSNDADTEVGGALADAITCNAIVKSFGAEEREDDRFDGTSQGWRLKSRRAWLRSMDAGAVQSVLLLGLLGGLLALVLVRSEAAAERVEGAVYVIATYLVVHGYLRNVGWQVRQAQRAINELDDLVAITKTAPQVENAPGAPDFVPGPGAIEFRGVHFGYRNQPLPVFRGLDVRVRPGERLALVGESGSGKSTFAKLVQRLYDVQGGGIRIDGQDVSQVTQESLRRAISVVPQEPILFHRSLAENIAYGRPGAASDEIVAAARKAHAHEFIAKLERGYDTLVGERGIKLSGGERQRVAIARAILADAPILVLDEATSSLDSVTEHLIQEALAALMEDRTAIVIAHRLSTIRQVDRILVFDHGRIIEEGSHDELVRRVGGRYQRLVEMQTLAGGVGEWTPRPPERRAATPAGGRTARAREPEPSAGAGGGAESV